MTGRPAPAPVWLFPVTYVVHLLEEYFVAGGFPNWAQRALGIQLSNREFVAWNAFALAAMCAGALLVSRYRRFRYIEIGLAIAVLGNVAAHVLGSLATQTYSPGLITGVVVWIPLGWFRLRTVFRDSSRRGRLAGICLGVLVTAVILTVLMSQLNDK
jgi:multisubunit Na+/H+ antiporter MnhF subunit